MDRPWHEARTIWVPTDAELPVRVKRTIASEKGMIVIFWGSHGIAYYCWVSKNSTLDSPFFCEEVIRPLAQKMQSNSKKTCKPLILIHMDNARVHVARATHRKWDISRFKRTARPPYCPDLASSDFSFRLAEIPAWTERIEWWRWIIWSSGWKFDGSLNRNDRNGLCRPDESTPTLDWWKWWLRFVKYHKRIFELN
jgi:transposase